MGKKFENGKIVSEDDEDEEKEKTAEGGGKYLFDNKNNRVVDYFVEDKYFERQMDRWGEIPGGSYVKVGVIKKGHPVNLVGMPEGTLRYDVSKLRKNMQDHTYLTEDLLKKIPKIISDPVVIAEYTAENTVNVFGEFFIDKSPMMVAITISRDRAGNRISKVRTYNARRDADIIINDKNVLYLDENKKRTQNWFQAFGKPVPCGETKFGFIRSISQKGDSVNHIGQFSFKEDPSNNEKVGESVEKAVDNKKKPTSYTKAEAVEMVSGILTEFFSAPEYAGKIKNMSDAVKMAMSTLNGAGAYDATYVRK